MKKLIYWLPILIVLGCSSEQPQIQNATETHRSFDYQFIVDKIDSTVLISGLHVGEPTYDHSGEGLPRTRWQIHGTLQSSSLEAIGIESTNVKVLSGSCYEFDQDGNNIGWPAQGVCATLFKTFLSKIVDKPDAAFANMIQHAQLQPYQQSINFQSVIENEHLVLTLSNDGFFFLRNNKAPQ